MNLAIYKFVNAFLLYEISKIVLSVIDGQSTEDENIFQLSLLWYDYNESLPLPTIKITTICEGITAF